WRVSPVDLARYLARVFARDNADDADAALASHRPLDADTAVTPPPNAAVRSTPAEPTRETLTLKPGRRSPPQGAAVHSGRARRASWIVAALGVAACAVGAIAWSASDASVGAHERADLP